MCPVFLVLLKQVGCRARNVLKVLGKLDTLRVVVQRDARYIAGSASWCAKTLLPFVAYRLLLC